MKITFVVGSLPFPARQGIELPLEKLIHKLSGKHTISILVFGENETAYEDFHNRVANVPNEVNDTNFVQLPKATRITSLFNDMLLIYPAFFKQNSPLASDILSDVMKSSDIIWVSPFGNLGALHLVRKRLSGQSGKIVVGLNDSTYGLYANGFRHLIKRWKYQEWRRIFNTLRTPWIAYYEWKFLKDVDALHVQTKLEKERCERLFKFERHAPQFICKQNGKGNLGQTKIPKNDTLPIVLLMTHLSGGRKNESAWFLSEVWPKVIEKIPSAQLEIVGSPPQNLANFKKTLPNNVQILGYVEDLDHVLKRARVGVIPTLHRSGWVNRISDYMGAGLPIVACSEPLSTIEGLVPGEHAYSADTPQDFANKVIDILSNPNNAEKLSQSAQKLAATFPTWDETTEHIESKLLDLIKS